VVHTPLVIIVLAVITGAAVTGDSPDERSVMLCTYYSQWPVTGWRKRPTGIPLCARRRPGATASQGLPKPGFREVPAGRFWFVASRRSRHRS
jgi:hypothetical protein